MLKLCICYSYLSNIYIHICIYICIVISTFIICISIFIFIHVYVYTSQIYIHDHTESYIHTYMYIYINILRETHIYLSKIACYTVSSNDLYLERNSKLPRSGAASVGVKKVNSLEELRATYEARRWHFGVGKILKVYLNKSPTCYHENQLRAPKKWTGYSVYCPGGDCPRG